MTQAASVFAFPTAPPSRCDDADATVPRAPGLERRRDACCRSACALDRRYQALLEVMPVGVVTIDGTGVIIESNPAALELLGDTLRGARWGDVVARSFRAALNDGVDVQLVSGRIAHVMTCALHDGSGQMVLLSDVTETRALQARSQRARRLSEIGRLVAAAAHQLRTPLAAAVISATSLLSIAERSPVIRLPDSGWRALSRLVERLRNLSRLVDDMLAFARVGRLEVERMVLGPWLDGLSANLAARYPSVALVLEVAPSARSAEIFASAEPLASAFDALVHNATRTDPPATRVRLDVSAAGAAAVDFHVSDDGPGISDDVAPMIFDPFYTTRTDGSGLGLSVVRSIAQAHGGDVVLAPSVTGARFRVRLPVAGSGGGSCDTATPAMGRSDLEEA